jgi:hypothetical protein
MNDKKKKNVKRCPVCNWVLTSNNPPFCRWCQKWMGEFDD